MELAAFGLAVTKALSPFAIALAGWAATAAANWLRAHTKSAAALGALSVLDNLAHTVVKDLEQTVVPTLKAKVADGTLSAADASAVKQEAINVINSYLGPKGREALVKALKMDDANLARLVGSKVELAVYNMNHPEQTGLPAFTVSSEYAAKAAAAGR